MFTFKPVNWFRDQSTSLKLGNDVYNRLLTIVQILEKYIYNCGLSHELFTYFILVCLIVFYRNTDNEAIRRTFY